MRILVDTDVILDYIANREPFASDAYRIMELCISKAFEGCIAAHTVTNLFYILRKALSVKERKAALLKLCRVFTVMGIDEEKILTALENEDYDDLEDCLQGECAKYFKADYIVTRNINDFSVEGAVAILPKDFLGKYALE